MAYEHKRIEEKWRKHWKDAKTYRVENDPSKPKFYALDMFPYPSGAGLHVGHPLGYIASDIVSRYKRHKGFNVLHPMGYDSFGLPAEQYAIQTGQHPAKTTEVNIARYREQLDNIGFSFDWSREVRTSEPSYYKWTQWIFLQLFDSWYDHEQNKARPISDLIERFEKQGWNGVDGSAVTGNEELDPLVEFSHSDWATFSEKHQQQILLRFRLAYLSEAWVNWCPALGTVLANDEVKDGVSERGGHPVERKRMPQWSMRMTAYAQRLLDGLNDLDWSESIKEAQRNWIGRSEGALIRFALTPALSLPRFARKGEGETARTPNPSPKERDFRAGYLTADGSIAGKLMPHANSMRKNPTMAEDKLWQAIRGSATGGRIRRQHIIDRFIVDFVSLPKQLVIEVDGDIHDLQKEEDAARTQRLAELGFGVIRFTNEEVLADVISVRNSIIAALSKRPDFAKDADLAETDEAHSPLSFASEARQGEGRGEGAFTDEAHSPLSLGEGRGEGAFIDVFTTRPDTIFGVSFVTLAPEHELIEKITPPERMTEVMAYVTQAKNRSERERLTEVKRVSGVFTGAYVKHPFTHLEIPVWVGDYVLGGYGTGAVMAVPAGDQRDWNFATHFNIPFTAVTENWDISKGADESKEATLTNSVFLNGMKVADAIPRAIDELIAKNAGERRINFRLRDAAFGRQRYWGEPIPIYYKDGTPYAVKEEHLPLVLPEVDKYQPTESGEPPLARAKDWCYSPLHGKTRLDDAYSPLSLGEGRGEGAFPLETTTMPGWAGSSWYFLRYMDPHNEGRFASPEAINYWKQVDLYVGGSEHATGHLLYFRFWTKFLKDRGWIDFDEPAKKLVNQGMITGRSAKAYRMNYSVIYNPNDASYDAHLTTGKPWGPQVFVAADLIRAWEQKGTEASKHAVTILERGLEEHQRKINEIFPHAKAILGLHADPAFALSSLLVPSAFVGIDDVSVNEADLVAFDSEFKGATFICESTFKVEREVDKMSKSKFNVVNPDDIIDKYGADTLRLYEMFLGPIEQSKPWDTAGIEGTSRFLKKFWNLFYDQNDGFSISEEQPTKAELKILHATLKKVEEDIDKMSFNTSVSQFMIACNGLHELWNHAPSQSGSGARGKRQVLQPLVIALAPFAPHIAEELWSSLGHNTSITVAAWPKWDAQYLVEDNFSYPISFNGKTRMQLEFPTALSKEEVEAQVLANPEVQQRLEGKPPKKVIVVPKRIVNIVV